MRWLERFQVTSIADGPVADKHVTPTRPAEARRPRGKVFIAQQSLLRGSGSDVFGSYPPPLDLESDMLFVCTAGSTRELRRHFAQVPFVTLGDTTPLVLWFSRIRTLTFGAAGARQTLDESSGFGYNELNIVALTRGRRLFVPVIYATGGLTQRLGHRYGMPKALTKMTFEASETQIASAVEFATARSVVRALLLASGRILSRPVDWLAPWWTWPVDFPDGSYIRALIQRVPRAQLARVRGVLTLDEPWHPRSTRLSPLGVYVPGLRMRLPTPG